MVSIAARPPQRTAQTAKTSKAQKKPEAGKRPSVAATTPSTPSTSATPANDIKRPPASGGAVAHRGDMALTNAHFQRSLNAKLQTEPPPPGAEDLLSRAEGLGSVSDDERAAINNLTGAERRMYGKTLDELDALKAGDINASQYFSNVMQHAADIAGDDGNKYVALTSMAFSEPAANTNKSYSVFDFQRGLAGAGAHPAGQVLERINQDITQANGGSGTNTGFNQNVIDADSSSTITHHFGEFLQVGANRWDWMGRRVQDQIDSKDTNPGDVRNGYFGVMAGDAVSDGSISPDEAAKLTGWAFTSDDAPWGATDDGDYLSDGDYKLNDWVTAYNEAHPGEPISID